MSLKLSIITGTTRESDYNRFFDSLKHIKTPFQLVVSDASQAYYSAKRHVKDIPALAEYKTIHEWPPSGHITGYNLAFSKTTGEYVVWFNDDVEVMAGFDTVLLNHMNAHPNTIGAIFFYDQGGQPRVCSYHGILYANFGCVSRSIGESLTWFDSRFYMYAGDVAFSLLAISKGIETLPVKGCRVFHHRPLGGHEAHNADYMSKYGPIAVRDNALLEKDYSAFVSRMRSEGKIKRTYPEFLYENG